MTEVFATGLRMGESSRWHDGRTLYITANAWSDGAAGDGVVLTERVDVPHAGHP